MNKFDLRGKLEQKTVLKRISALATGSIPAPVSVDFDCTTRCNLACFFCISKNMLGTRDFSREQLMDWADVLCDMDIKSIILTGGGEPLMNEHVDDFIYRLKSNDANIAIGLVTNGTLIDKHKYLKELNWMRISLDAGKASTYTELKGKSFYDLVVRNIALFNKDKGCCETGISYLVIRDGAKANIEEMAATANLAKEIGCNYFEIKLQFDMNHHDISLIKSDMQELQNQISMAKALSDDTFRVYLNHNISNTLASDTAPCHTAASCHICNLRTIIAPSGLYVCSYHRGKKQYKYGESDPTRFKQYWYSKGRQDLIASIHIPSECNFNCARKNSNALLQHIIRGEKDGSISSMSLPDEDLFI